MTPTGDHDEPGGQVAVPEDALVHVVLVRSSSRPVKLAGEAHRPVGRVPDAVLLGRLGLRVHLGPDAKSRWVYMGTAPDHDQPPRGKTGANEHPTARIRNPQNGNAMRPSDSLGGGSFWFCFGGFFLVHRAPPGGYDESYRNSGKFQFEHPVSAGACRGARARGWGQPIPGSAQKTL